MEARGQGRMGSSKRTNAMRGSAGRSRVIPPCLVRTHRMLEPLKPDWSMPTWPEARQSFERHEGKEHREVDRLPVRETL